MTDGINELVELVPILKRVRMDIELDNYQEYIINARKKKYTYQSIANMLKKNGINVSTKTIQRFVRRQGAETNHIHP
jgi:IS30 family transposase